MATLRQMGTERSIGSLGKGKAFKGMVEEYEDSRHATQTVEEFVVRLGVGKEGY